MKKGSFTLPGEAGYEKLTLALAEKWGADCIRDSDGTELSSEIVNSGFDIYSTICLVRSDNEWAKKNTDKLQQNFLISYPVIAESDTVIIEPLNGYFREQFVIDPNSTEYWQVFDRTENKEMKTWSFDGQKVIIKNAKKYHKYTVNVMVFRIWEEISMYNHITNNWDKEHLMSIEPRHPEAQAHILKLLEQWLIDHPHTNVVRFTSMFYNFSWFWGEDIKRLRDVFSDWGTYAMTVNPIALQEFYKEYGYKMTSEDFIDNGKYHQTHNVPSQKYMDWIHFTNKFVVDFGKKCVELVHKYQKLAYVFYDDHWIGIEPYSKLFPAFQFDGIIKCVFNAFEARKCAGVQGVQTRELRLHPYLFPTGLKGEPTFMDGGNPTLDAKKFWADIRRAIIRDKIDRIGLGGYLHLVEPFPTFNDYIAQVADEFRLLKSYHEEKPYVAPFKIAVLTAWGRLRSWICSGHMTEGIDHNEMLESLAGLPLDIEFIDFNDIINGRLSEFKVVINCGDLNTAWSGGEHWENPVIIEKINAFVANGGGFVGIKEPAAIDYSTQYFQVSDILGVEKEIGLKQNNGKYIFDVNSAHFITRDIDESIHFGKECTNVYVIGAKTNVILANEKSVRLATNQFFKGRGVYMAGHTVTAQNTRLLHRAIFYAAGCENTFDIWNSENIYTECAYFANAKKLVVINNTKEGQTTIVTTNTRNQLNVDLEPFGIKILDI